MEFVGTHGIDVPECVYRHDPAPGGIPRRWVYLISCEGGFDKLDKVIRFNVRDLDGNLLGEEAIPYEIERDGFFYYLDAI